MRLRLLILLAAPVAAFAADGGTARFLWDVPQVLESVPVSAPLKSLGVSMKLHAVKSKLGMEALFRHFLREFDAANFYIPPKEGQFQVPGGLQLTGLDTRAQISYTVIFQPNPDGTTTVILGEADLAHREPPKSTGLPVFPQARDVLQAVSEGSLTLTYEVDASSGDLAAFYRETLGRAGYREQAGAFVREGEEIRVLAQGHPDAGSLFITVVQRKASAR